MWIRSKDWIVRVDEPALLSGSEQTLRIDFELAEKSVQFLRGGEPVANQQMTLQVLPMRFLMDPMSAQIVTDGDGRATLKMGVLPAGSVYRFTESGSRTPGLPRLTAEFPWTAEGASLTVDCE